MARCQGKLFCRSEDSLSLSAEDSLKVTPWSVFSCGLFVVRRRLSFLFVIIIHYHSHSASILILSIRLSLQFQTFSLNKRAEVQKGKPRKAANFVGFGQMACCRWYYNSSDMQRVLVFGDYSSWRSLRYLEFVHVCTLTDFFWRHKNGESENLCVKLLDKRWRDWEIRWDLTLREDSTPGCARLAVVSTSFCVSLGRCMLRMLGFEKLFKIIFDYFYSFILFASCPEYIECLVTVALDLKSQFGRVFFFMLHFK